jgi:hypothetical protein
MDQQLVNALIGFGGAILGSAITVGAMIVLQRKANRSIELDEIRKRKVEIIYQLLGSRYVLSENYQATETDVKAFNTAMALFSIYFAKHPKVMTAYDKVLNSKSDDNIVEMLRAAAETANLELLDTHIKRVMTVSPKTIALTMLQPNIPSTKASTVSEHKA